MDSKIKFRPRLAGLVILVATALTVVETGQSYLLFQNMGKPQPFLAVLPRAALEWYLIGLLAPGVFWASTKFPYTAGRTWRWVGFHTFCSFLFALTYILIHAWILNGRMSWDGTPYVFKALFQKMFFYYCHVEMLIYWMILLAHQGWHFYRNYRAQQVHAAELRTQLVGAKLDALRMQLNPHFLFNTLHTISSLIHDAPQKADTMVTRLSELLRASLDRAQENVIPLKEEIAFLERYLDIEQTRFGGRLATSIRIPNNCQDRLVPAMILQPIVENAIRHGVEQCEEGGRVEIEASLVGSHLELVVRDNGPGMPADSKNSSRKGIGLANTKSRLEHLYGEDHSLGISCIEKGGLEVKIKLPASQGLAKQGIAA